MASVIQLFKNGGQVVTDVELLLSKVEGIIKENEVFKLIIEKQGAIIVSLKDEMGVISRKLDAIQDEVTISKRVTDEIKHTKFIGQTTKILPKAIERAETISGNEVRKLIRKAAGRHPKGYRKGYNYVYEKLFEATGFDVYSVGQISLKKSDGIDGWNKDRSYINAVLREGYKKEVAVVCMQILADK